MCACVEDEPFRRHILKLILVLRVDLRAQRRGQHELPDGAREAASPHQRPIKLLTLTQ